MDDYAHESVQEFVSEFDHQSHYGDLCDLHFEFHIPIVLDRYEVRIAQNSYKQIAPQTKKLFHSTDFHNNLIKPPII
jgi:hypothetical protein